MKSEKLRRGFKAAILILLFFAAAMEWQGIPFTGGCAHFSAQGTARNRPLLPDQKDRAGHAADKALVVVVEKIALDVPFRVGRHHQ